MSRHSSSPRLLLVPLLVVACWAAPMAPSAWATPEYAASLQASCCSHEVIESGATEKQYLTVTNAGTATWGAPGVDSIDVGPQKAGTPKGEFVAASWTMVNGDEPRASVGVSHEVSPGASYRFVFEVKAPAVSQPTTFSEHFGLAADGDGSARWLKGAGATLEYTVVPAQPPTISVTPSATSIAVGGSFTVSASATSVASVNRVMISFAGQSVTSAVPRDPEGAADEQTSWTANVTFATAGVGTGPQTVVATAYDDAGLSATTTATVQVQAPQVAVAPPGPSVLDGFRMYFAGLTVPKHAGELQLTRLVILGTRAGEHVSVTCAHCRGDSRLGQLSARGDEVTFRPRHLVVTDRSRLTVYATAAGSYGRYKQYAISVGRLSVVPRSQGCLAPGTRTHSRCPG